MRVVKTVMAMIMSSREQALGLYVTLGNALFCSLSLGFLFSPIYFFPSFPTLLCCLDYFFPVVLLF